MDELELFTAKNVPIQFDCAKLIVPEKIAVAKSNTLKINIIPPILFTSKNDYF